MSSSTIVSNGSTLTIENTDGFTLTVDGTIAPLGLLDGTGNIGDGDDNLTLVNLGTIASDAPGGTISLNLGTLTNDGTVIANSESIFISTTSFTNAGTAIANNATFNIASTVLTPDLTGDDLTEGTWIASAGGEMDLLTGLIVDNQATITMDGATSTFNDYDYGGGHSDPLGASLGTIDTTGVLNLLNGQDFTLAAGLLVDGSLNFGGGTIVTNAGSGGDTITVAASGQLTGFGDVTEGSQIQDNGLILANGGGTLTLPDAGSFAGVGTLQSDAGSSLALTGSGTPYSQTINNIGTIDAIYGNVFGAIGSVAISGAYSGAGAFLIDGGIATLSEAILELPGSISANVGFTNFGELILDAPASFTGTISGFNDNDSMVLTGIVADTATLIGNILSLTANGTFVQGITLNTGSVDYSAATFAVAAGSVVSVSGSQAAACYAAGTRIKTASGEVKVEDLIAGDVVRAHFAGTAAVVWVGHRHVDCRRHPEPDKVWPVRIEAHAFGPRMPHSDLLLSPDHAVFVDDMLIPIKRLINGKTISQVKMDEVTYYHVELAEHDIVLAEGMPAETYLENGDRCAFDNGGVPISLHPDFESRRWEAFGCAPLVLTGAKLDAVSARVDARIPKGKRLSRKRLRAA